MEPVFLIHNAEMLGSFSALYSAVLGLKEQSEVLVETGFLTVVGVGCNCHKNCLCFQGAHMVPGAVPHKVTV